MKTFAEFMLECSLVKESSLARIKSKSDKGGMSIVLSATRTGKSSKENRARNKQLDKDIRGRGLTILRKRKVNGKEEVNAVMLFLLGRKVRESLRKRLKS